MQVRHLSQTSRASISTESPIGDALRAAGVLDLTGPNAKFASERWLSAPVRLIACLTPAQVVICKAMGYKTLGDIMGLRVAWVPHFGEAIGLKLLHVQNALRPVLMNHGPHKSA